MPSEAFHRALQALFGVLGGLRDPGQSVEQGPSGILERPFRALGQGGERVVQCGFDTLLNRCLQVKGGFLPAVVEGVRRLGGSLAGGGQRPRLLFEPAQQLGDAVLLLVGQLNQGGEELLGLLLAAAKTEDPQRWAAWKQAGDALLAEKGDATN